jgi:hypothetical protein
MGESVSLMGAFWPWSRIRFFRNTRNLSKIHAGAAHAAGRENAEAYLEFPVIASEAKQSRVPWEAWIASRSLLSGGALRRPGGSQ